MLGIHAMTKVAQSKQDLRRHLSENLGFLAASAAAFDNGFYGEAKRLAVTIRVLLHDTASSKSLLGLLGYKNGMGFLNTAPPYDPKNLVSHHGLVGLRLGNREGRYFAPLGEPTPSRPHRYIFFPDWWNQIVIVDGKKNSFTRRDLVLGLANKDGGAHVDPNLDGRYADLTRNNSIGWTISNGLTSHPLNDVELHSVRQVAFEVAVSIERRLAKLAHN